MKLAKKEEMINKLARWRQLVDKEIFTYLNDNLFSKFLDVAERDMTVAEITWTISTSIRMFSLQLPVRYILIAEMRHDYLTWSTDEFIDVMVEDPKDATTVKEYLADVYRRAQAAKVAQ